MPVCMQVRISVVTSIQWLAAGLLNTSGTLNNRGTNGYYWSSSQNSSTNGRYLFLSSSNANVTSNNKANGFSVRCLRDYFKNHGTGIQLVSCHV